MAIFLFKTEPSEYSYDMLAADTRTMWTGVSNNTALIHLRACRKGDSVLMYHTGDEKAIVGVAKVVAAAIEDPSRPGLNGKGEPKFAVVEIMAVKKAKTPLTLAAIKADARFSKFPLVTQSRLSVMPVPADLEKIVRQAAGL